MSVCRSDETGRSTFDASGGHVDVSGGHDAQTSDGALSATNSSAQPVEIIHQDVDTIGRSDEASRSAFDASGGHRAQTSNGALSVTDSVGALSVESNRQEVETFARDHFGIQHLKDAQWEVIESVVYHRKNTIFHAPTGSGKSLTMQIPPLIKGSSGSKGYYHAINLASA
jgi:hypothetical protein